MFQKESVLALWYRARTADSRIGIIGGFQLSAILRKPSPGNAAAEPNPHRRPTAHRLPAGSFFGGFRTPAPHSASTAHARPASETLTVSGRSPDERKRANAGR